MAISSASIMSKLEAYAKTPVGKQKMNAAISSIRKSGKMGGRTAAGSEVLTVADMSVKADELVENVKRSARSFAAESGAAYGVPPNILSKIDSLTHSNPIELPSGDYSVDIYFTGDLSKRSLLHGQESIENIIALFNNGYHASGYVYGIWEGHDIFVRSRKDRPQLHFMQTAVNDFNRNYTAKYGAKAILSEDYE